MPKKNLILNVIVLIILVLVIAWVYRFQMKNYANLELTKASEIKKSEVIEVISGLEKRMLAYKKILPKKEINTFVNTITDLAGKYRIKIDSMQPIPEEVKDYYIQLSVNLGIAASGYHQLGNFISALERAPEIFDIDVIEVKGQESAEGAGAAKGLTVTLKVSTYIYKE